MWWIPFLDWTPADPVVVRLGAAMFSRRDECQCRIVSKQSRHIAHVYKDYDASQYISGRLRGRGKVGHGGVGLFPARRDLDPGRFRFHVEIVIILLLGETCAFPTRARQHGVDISNSHSYCVDALTATILTRFACFRDGMIWASKDRHTRQTCLLR